MGDDERARFGRKRTEPPVEAAPVAVDNDFGGKTPVPHDLEQAREWHHLDNRLTEFERDIRGRASQITRHEAEIEQWSKLTKQHSADIQDAAHALTEISANMAAFFARDWKRVTEALDGFAESIRDFDRRIGKLESGIEHVVGKQSTHAHDLARLAERVERLELDKRDTRVAAAERNRIVTFLRVAVVAAAGAVGWLVKHLTS